MKACVVGYNPQYSEDEPSIDQIRAMAGYAVLEFGAPWCGHCHKAVQAAQDVLTKRALPHIKVFDGKGKPLGRSFKVKLWPTLILLHSGQEVVRVVRPVNETEVKQLLDHADG